LALQSDLVPDSRLQALKEADKAIRRAEYAAAHAAKNAPPATPEAKAAFFEPGSYVTSLACFSPFFARFSPFSPF